jgi:hypothetical protein
VSLFHVQLASLLICSILHVLCAPTRNRWYARAQKWAREIGAMRACKRIGEDFTSLKFTGVVTLDAWREKNGRTLHELLEVGGTGFSPKKIYSGSFSIILGDALSIQHSAFRLASVTLSASGSARFHLRIEPPLLNLMSGNTMWPCPSTSGSSRAPLLAPWLQAPLLAPSP